MQCRTRSLSSPLLLLLLLILSISTLSSSTSTLRRGSALKLSDLLTSPDGSFTCGFYTTGLNAFWFSIWYTHSADPTLVWIANRDKPVNGQSSKVSLRRDGGLVLTDVDASVVWLSNTSSFDVDVDRAELMDTGNLVLRNPSGHVQWESFDLPTNTLLPGQTFTKSNKLVSNLGPGQFGSGYYALFFGNDNVLRLVYDGPEISSLYWPDPNPNINVYDSGRTNYNSTRVAKLDDLGRFKSSDRLEFNASDYGPGVRRRLTLDHDGNFRLYSLNASTGFWNVSWQALIMNCNIHGVCGRYGICSYEPEPKCSCPPGYEVRNPSNWNEGCRPKFNLTCSGNSRIQQAQVKYLELLNTDYYGFDLNFTQSVTFEQCKRICDEDCNCEGFSYKLTSGQAFCFPKYALFNGYNSPNFPGTIYLKVPLSLQAGLAFDNDFKGSDASCEPSGSTVPIGSLTMYDISYRMLKWGYLYVFAGVIGGVEIFFAIVAWWFLFRKHGESASVEDGYRAITSQFKVFSYAELKTATNNFKEQIGQGGSGTVYKGVLDDDRVIAVKRLGDIMQGEEVFKAELSTIGKIYHMNLVRMWGFCLENRRKLIVYEHIKNLSLDKHLFSIPNSLGWNQRFKIALGTAKGLAYLHHECLEWVIHCDVKPENILLDGDFEPKIADFGLAKLSQRGGPGSEFSHIRGTKGYMAPEWASNLPITAKVDVYSYGVVILELVRGIRLSSWVLVGDGNVQEAEMTRFVREAKLQIKAEENDSWVKEVLDPQLHGQFNIKQAVRMVEIGISCVEEDSTKRPTMDAVVRLLLTCEVV
ncbi:unnamed protein product [Rhodiola kirilowii]